MADSEPNAAEPAEPADSSPADTAAESELGALDRGTEEVEQLLDAAEQTLDTAAGGDLDPAGGDLDPAAGATPFELGDLQPGEPSDDSQPIDLIGEVEMDLRIELGRTQMKLSEVLQLRPGSVVALDKLAGDPVDVYANGRLIARGEVLVMNDNFCVRITELVGA